MPRSSLEVWRDGWGVGVFVSRLGPEDAVVCRWRSSGIVGVCSFCRVALRLGEGWYWSWEEVVTMVVVGCGVVEIWGRSPRLA